MTTHVLRTQDGKKVVIDVSKDVRLYSAPVNPPNTGTQYTRGTDLLAHTARSGNVYFYFYNWSMWQGEEDSFKLMEDREEIEALLIEKAGLSYPAGLDEHEIEQAREYGFDLMEETA